MSTAIDTEKLQADADKPFYTNRRARRGPFRRLFPARKPKAHRTHTGRPTSKLPTEKVVHKTTAPWRGYDAAGGGLSSHMAFTKIRGTSRQLCGIYPYPTGTASPLVGVPLGVHDDTLEPFGFDPLSWFDRRMIFNPSVFILGSPAIGKSTLIRRIILGIIASGTKVLILGDRKDEYTDMMEALGKDHAQIIHLGPGRGIINILDPGEALEAAERIREKIDRTTDKKDVRRLTEIYNALLGDMHNRRLQMVVALIETFRDEKVSGRESSILDEAMRWLHANHEGVPTLADVLHTIRPANAPTEVRDVANDYGNDEIYRAEVRPLESDLTGLCSGGGLGALFNGQTTQKIKRDRSISFDLSGIDPNERATLGTAFLASWSAGYGMINVAHALADAGLEEPQRFVTVKDEYWQALACGPGMVDRDDAISRLNRDQGVANIYATHKLSDLNRIRDIESREKAKAVASNAGCLIIGGVNREELDENHAERFNRIERRRILSWSTPASRNKDGSRGDMPGRGKFLLKQEGAPGIPFRVLIPEIEHRYDIHDTNKRIRSREERQQMEAAA